MKGKARKWDDKKQEMKEVRVMKDKWMWLIVIAFLGQLVMTWGFMVWTWGQLQSHERALANHARVIQQLIPAPQPPKQ